MATDSSSSFVIFLYADLQWAFADPKLAGMGSASGSGSADEISLSLGFGIVGFLGPGLSGSQLPGSGSSDILELNTTSNVGRPGLWIFRVDGEEVISGGTHV